MYKNVDNENFDNQIDDFWNPSSPLSIASLPNVERVMTGHSYWTVWPVKDLVSHRKALNDKIKEHSGLKYWQTEYLNEGYEWVIDIDIEQFFDKVNHDKLIQILREQVNDSSTLQLIRKYLKAGAMEKGLEKATMASFFHYLSEYKLFVLVWAYRFGF